MLPIAPFTETAGCFVNAEGRAQSFHGVVRPLGETRPGWKVLRVLGNLLGLDGFAQESAEEVRAEALGDLATLSQRLDNRAALPQLTDRPTAAADFERVSDVPIYATDALVRRAESLQRTADARPPVASLPTGLWRSMALQPGARVRLTQGEGQVELPAVEDPTLAATAVRVSAGLPATVGLGPMFGPIRVEKA